MSDVPGTKVEALRRIVKAVVPLSLRFAARGAYASARFRGRNVFCPCCGGWFDSFVAGEWSPALCPGCLSFERHRMLWLHLCAKERIQRKCMRVLHIGPAWTLHRRISRMPNLEYVAGDKDCTVSRKRIDVMDLEYGDGSFDLAISCHVLEHVPDDRRAIAELHRVLRPGGRLIVEAPVDSRLPHTLEDQEALTPEDRQRAFGHPAHLRLYGRDFANRLSRPGFSVSAIDVMSDLDPWIVKTCGLPANEMLCRCVKRQESA